MFQKWNSSSLSSTKHPLTSFIKIRRLSKWSICATLQTRDFHCTFCCPFSVPRSHIWSPSMSVMSPWSPPIWDSSSVFPCHMTLTLLKSSDPFSCRPSLGLSLADIFLWLNWDLLTWHSHYCSDQMVIFYFLYFLCLYQLQVFCKEELSLHIWGQLNFRAGRDFRIFQDPRCLWHQITWELIRNAGPAHNLPDQHLHFNKIPEWSMCSVF